MTKAEKSKYMEYHKTLAKCIEQLEITILASEANLNKEEIIEWLQAEEKDLDREKLKIMVASGTKSKPSVKDKAPTLSSDPYSSNFGVPPPIIPPIPPQAKQEQARAQSDRAEPETGSGSNAFRSGPPFHSSPGFSFGAGPRRWGDRELFEECFNRFFGYARGTGRARFGPRNVPETGESNPTTGASARPPPEPNYKGIKRLEPKVFSGDEFDYPFWKAQFKAAFRDRNIPNDEMALNLISYLNGAPLKLARTMITEIDEGSYDLIWQTLDRRYGGEFREDQVITEQFEKARPLDSYKLKELERFTDLVTSQLNYYSRTDPEALTNSKSLLMKQARRKLGYLQGHDYMKYVEDKSLTDTFPSLVKFLEWKLKTTQRVDKEFGAGSRSSVSSERRQVHSYSNEEIEPDYEPEIDQSESYEIDISEELDSVNLAGNRTNTRPRTSQVKVSYPAKNSNPNRVKFSLSSGKNSQVKTKVAAVYLEGQCVICKVKHEIPACKKFLAMKGERRNSVVKTFKLCFHCLKGNHRVRECQNRVNQTCNVNGCARYHHPLLHDENTYFYEDYDSETGSIADYEEETSDSYYVAKTGAISLQTVVVKINGKAGSVSTVALLDSGSNTTLISSHLAEKVQAPILEANVPRKVNYVDRSASFKANRVQVMLQVGNSYQNLAAWTVSNLSNTGVVDWSKAKSQFPHLREIPFQSLPQEARLGLIIGTDHNFLFRPLKVVENPENSNDPRATLTPLGWTCTGPSSSGNKVKYNSFNR
jgi:hypothetical protein